MRAATGLLQSHHVGQRAVGKGTEEVAVALLLLLLAELRVLAAVPGAVVVLHIDEQQRAVRRFDGDLAARRMIHRLAPKKMRSASCSACAMRRAHSLCPDSSATRSWRISIATYGSARASAWRGIVKSLWSLTK